MTLAEYTVKIAAIFSNCERNMTKAPNFETSLKDLEKIVEQMEKPDLPLDEALKHFEEGVKLSQTCQKALDEAEQKIEKVQNSLEKQTPNQSNMDLMED